MIGRSCIVRSMENNAPDHAPVSILGATGDLGFGLALRLAREGVPVVIGSRSAERAGAAASRALDHLPGANVRGMTNDQAIAQGDTIVLSVPFASHAETLKGLKEHFRE